MRLSLQSCTFTILLPSQAYYAHIMQEERGAQA